MDSLFLLAGLLGVGDILLARVWWYERTRRLTAERHANDAIREKYKLLDIIERKAAKTQLGPVEVKFPADPVSIQSAVARLRARQAAERSEPA